MANLGQHLPHGIDKVLHDFRFPALKVIHGRLVHELWPTKTQEDTSIFFAAKRSGEITPEVG
jgi:hypothetical protein